MENKDLFLNSVFLMKGKINGWLIILLNSKIIAYGVW